jgi:histone H1/5
MASNKKRPMNKKNKIVAKPAAKKSVANKKVTVKAPVAKKPVAKRPVTKKPIVKKPIGVAAPEVKVEQVSLAEQIPAAVVCACDKPCKKNHTMAYVVFGVIVTALLLAIIF